MWSRKCPSMGDCVRGAGSTEIHPAVAPHSCDRVIDKKRASAFFGTPLHAELQAGGIDTLLVAGTSTSGCVRATVVDAAAYDYRVLVLKDCVDDRADASHRATLVDLQAKYADVVSLRDLEPQLRAAVARTAAAA